MEKLTLEELRKTEWNEAVIVFSNDSWDREYSETERSYKVNKSAKFFNPMMNGNSLFGSCLDGKDNGVRLDVYMGLLPEEGKRWLVEYCYITK